MHVGFFSALLFTVFLLACTSQPVTEPSQQTAHDSQSTSSSQSLPQDKVEAIPLNTVQSQALSFEGQFHGQRIWVDLAAAEQKPGAVRKLRVLYTPPQHDDFVGIIRHDHPHILVNDALFCGSWQERSSLTGYIYQGGTDNPGYAVTMEREQEIDGDTIAYEDTKFVVGDPVWDLDLAPVLLALLWSTDQQGRVTAARLFSERDTERVQIHWSGHTLIVGTDTFTIESVDGRLKAIKDSQGIEVLSIASWLKGL